MHRAQGPHGARSGQHSRPKTRAAASADHRSGFSTSSSNENISLTPSLARAFRSGPRNSDSVVRWIWSDPDRRTRQLRHRGRRLRRQPCTTLRRSSSCISRANVWRATTSPSRRSWRQTLRTPHTRKFSSHTNRKIISASRTWERILFLLRKCFETASSQDWRLIGRLMGGNDQQY